MLFCCNNVYMKKFIVMLLFALTLIVPSTTKPVGASDEPTKIRVVANQTIIYKEPSITSDVIISNCVYGTVFDVVSDDTIDYKLFYKISIAGMVQDQTIEFGYILKSHTLDCEIYSPKKVLDDNAVVKTDNAVVYQLVNNEFVATQKTLAKDTKLRVLDGYDSKKEYTFVSFLENDDIVSYYLKTSDVDAHGINYSLIVAIMTLITCACALSIVFGVKAKKKKKKRT